MRKLLIVFLIIGWLCIQYPHVALKVLEVIKATLQQQTTKVDSDNAEQPQNSSNNLQVFAKQLAECCQPGPLVRKWVSRYENDSPINKLLNIYAELREKWRYQSDEGEQHQSCEYSLGRLGRRSLKTGTGDCEDFAVTMAALLAECNDLTTRLVLCRGQDNSQDGHAYCEVLIGSDISTSKPIIGRLGTHWKIDQVMYRLDSDGAVWVALDFNPPASLYRGLPYAFIHPDGTVQIIE